MTGARDAAPETGLDLLDLGRGLRRRWWIVLGLPLLVGLLSLATYEPPPPRYQARLSFAVDLPASALQPGSDEGTAAKVGEALIDDMSRLVAGDRFAEAVQARLPEGVRLAPGESASSLSADDRHRVSDVTVTRSAAPDASAAERAALAVDLGLISEAIVAELEENAGTWFARLGADEVRLTIVDGPRVDALPPSARERLEIPLRLGLGLLLGLGLAAGLHLADPRLYDGRAAARATGAAVLGRVPGPRRRVLRRRDR